MSSRKVVFCTFGSLGDIHPIVAIAQEMKRRGHLPVMATSPVYRQIVEKEGVAFHSVRPDVDVSDPETLRLAMDPNTGMRYILTKVILPSLRETYEDTAAAACDADLLVTHPVTLSAYLYARKSKMPWAAVALAPASIFSAYDPPVYSGLPFAGSLAKFGPSFQRFLLKALSALLERDWKPYRTLEKDLGLTAAPNPLLSVPEAQKMLGLYSPLLGAPQRDWPQNSHSIGFPFYGSGQENPPELREFLNAGDPPIVFTLGSAAVGVAGDFFQQGAEAAHKLGRRAVLLVGRDPRNQPVGPLPPGTIAVTYAPHGAIFPRGCAVVHQGGIGTAAEAMRSGRPMLVVPFSHDQPDNAARLVRLGVGRSIPRAKFNSATAIRELRILLEEKSYAERAAEIGAQVQLETGLQNACDHLCELLGEAGNRKTSFSQETMATSARA